VSEIKTPSSEKRTASPVRRRKRKRRMVFFSSKAPFPIRTVVILVLILILSILLLGMAKGNLKQLAAEKQEAAAAYDALVQRHTYKYDDLIRKYAAENDIHPAFVAAIILRESSYNPRAESSVGARGLMQVMEKTFEDIRRWLGEENRTTFSDMYDPETNIRYGCYYLGRLSREFNGDPIKMASAYHAGANNVKYWMMNNSADGHTLTIDTIPTDDTRYYARKVYEAYAIYFQHYYPD